MTNKYSPLIEDHKDRCTFCYRSCDRGRILLGSISFRRRSFRRRSFRRLFISSHSFCRIHFVANHFVDFEFCNW